MGNSMTKRRYKGSGSKLTDKQRIFCAEYLKNGCSAVKAAKEAGYANPGQAGAKLLGLKHIKQELQARGTSLLDKKELTAKKVIDQLYDILQFNIMTAAKRSKAGYLEIDEESYEELAEAIGHCVTEVEFKEVEDEDGNITRTFRLKLMSKDKALELAMKYLGLLTDKHEVRSTTSINWDDLLLASYNNGRDPIEDRILEVTAERIE